MILFIWSLVLKRKKAFKKIIVFVSVQSEEITKLYILRVKSNIRINLGITYFEYFLMDNLRNFKTWLVSFLLFFWQLLLSTWEGESICGLLMQGNLICYVTCIIKRMVFSVFLEIKFIIWIVLILNFNTRKLIRNMGYKSWIKIACYYCKCIKLFKIQ